MNGETLFVAAIQSTVLLLVALGVCRLLGKSPSARLVICRAALVATLFIVFGFPWWSSRPQPLVPVSVPSLNLAHRHEANLRPLPIDPKVGSAAIGTVVNEPSQPTQVDPLAIAGGIWLVGVVMFGSMLIFGYGRLAELRLHSAVVKQGVVEDAVLRASEDLKVRAPQIRTGPSVVTPFVTGIWRPTMYVPGDWASTLDPEILDGICRHEIAHLAAGDLWWQLAYRICTILFWPQALLWVMTRHATLASEELCDRRVLASGYSAQTYASSLMRLREKIGGASNAVPVGIGAVSIRSAFGKRIEAIMNSTINVRKELSRSSLLGLVFGCAAVTGLTATVIAAPLLPEPPKADLAAKAPKEIEMNDSSQKDVNSLSGWLPYNSNGLIMSGKSPDGFLIGIDKTVSRNGKASGVISGTRGGPDDIHLLSQFFAATAYRGKRLRLSGYLKTKDVTVKAGFFMRVVGMDRIIAYDDMSDRAVTGTTDWAPYSVVLDIPDDAACIFMGSQMVGPGATWIDDLSVETVDPAKVPVTVDPEGRTGEGDASTPQNMNFSATPQSDSKIDVPGWMDSTDQWDVGRLDLKTTHKGNPTGTVIAKTATDDGESLFQEIRADEYRGKRVMFQAYIGGADKLSAGIFVAVPGGGQWARTLVTHGKVEKSADGKDWTLLSTAIDVPQWAKCIQFGAELMDKGQIWMSDCSFKVVDPNTHPVTQELPHYFTERSLKPMSKRPVNLDFEH